MWQQWGMRQRKIRVRRYRDRNRPHWTFVVNYRASAAAERRGRMPVLVFRQRTASGVVVDNVGNGPAMNIIFAQGRANDSSTDPSACMPTNLFWKTRDTQIRTLPESHLDSIETN